MSLKQLYYEYVITHILKVITHRNWYGVASVVLLFIVSILFITSIVVRADTQTSLPVEPEVGIIAGCGYTTKDSSASGGSAVTYGACPNFDTRMNVPAGMVPGAAYENRFASGTPAQQQAVIAQMKAAGVSWLRLDVPSTYPYDAMIKYAVAAGIHIDATLQNWSTASTPSAMAAFAAQAVAHLKPMGVSTYEILNETNGCGDTMSASDYTAILKASYTAIKGADPSAAVITAGMCPKSGANEPYTYLEAMYTAGAAGYFDAVAMHPYSYPDTPLQTTDTWNPWSYLGQLHQIMTSHGDGNKKLWLTEFGCPTSTSGGYPSACTDATLADQITDAFSLARTQLWIGPLFLYNWQDSGADDGDFGLYNADGSTKPLSLNAYTRASKN